MPRANNPDVNINTTRNSCRKIKYSSLGAIAGGIVGVLLLMHTSPVTPIALAFKAGSGAIVGALAGNCAETCKECFDELEEVLQAPQGSVNHYGTQPQPVLVQAQLLDVDASTPVIPAYLANDGRSPQPLPRRQNANFLCARGSVSRPQPLPRRQNANFWR